MKPTGLIFLFALQLFLESCGFRNRTPEPLPALPAVDQSKLIVSVDDLLVEMFNGEFRRKVVASTARPSRFKQKLAQVEIHMHPSDP